MARRFMTSAGPKLFESRSDLKVEVTWRSSLRAPRRSRRIDALRADLSRCRRGCALPSRPLPPPCRPRSRPPPWCSRSPTWRSRSCPPPPGLFPPPELARMSPPPPTAVGDIIVVAFAIAFLVPLRPVAAIAAFAGLAAMLRTKLRLRRHDDAVVMLGVLEIALRRDQVAGSERVAGERHVFLGDMRRGPANFHVGTVRFKAPRQRILGLAATAAAPAILLSLPHRLRCNPDLAAHAATSSLVVSCLLGSSVQVPIHTSPGRAGPRPSIATGKCNSAMGLRTLPA